MKRARAARWAIPILRKLYKVDQIVTFIYSLILIVIYAYCHLSRYISLLRTQCPIYSLCSQKRRVVCPCTRFVRGVHRNAERGVSQRATLTHEYFIHQWSRVSVCFQNKVLLCWQTYTSVSGVGNHHIIQILERNVAEMWKCGIVAHGE